MSTCCTSTSSTCKMNCYGQRLVVVFRDGKQVMMGKDSGTACAVPVQPKKPIEYVFGNHLVGLVEGQLYTREDLVSNSYHRYVLHFFLSLYSNPKKVDYCCCLAFGFRLVCYAMFCFSYLLVLSKISLCQKGVSGNVSQGCDSIIVSKFKLHQTFVQYDMFSELKYYAAKHKGALGLFKSFYERLPIRVFRTTHDYGRYRAVDSGNGKKTKYRYDGLYYIQYAELENYVNGIMWYSFLLKRGETRIGCAYSNTVKTKVLIAACIKNGIMESDP